MAEKREDKSGLAIGGMTMLGVGVGLIFVQSNPILMVASVIIGIGLGLVIASMLKGKKGIE